MTSDQNPLDLAKKLTERLDVDFALQAAGLGVWEYNPVTNLVVWNDRCRALFGLTEGNILTYEEAIQYIHPDDVNRVGQAVQWAQNSQSGGSYDQTYRTLGADDGVLRWVRFVGRSYFSKTGELERFAGIALDVTEENRKEEALQEVQRHYQPAFDNATVGIVVTAKNGEMLLVNKAYQQLTGYSADELYRKSHRNLTHPDDLPYNQQLIDQLGRGEIPYFDLDKRYIRKDGSVIWVRFNVSRLVNEQGQTESLFGICYDITEQVKNRQLVTQSDARLQAVIDESPVATALHVGADLRIEVANDTILGYWNKDRSVLGKSFRQAIPELAGQGYFELLDEVYATGRAYQAQAAPARLTIRDQPGVHYFDLSFKPLRNGQGEVYAILNTATNVTEQVLTRHKLEESEARFRTMAEGSPILIAIGDETGNATYFNKGWIDFTGKTPDDLIAFGWVNLLHPNDKERYMTGYRAAFAVRESFTSECRVLNALGVYRWLLAQGTARFDEGGVFLGYITACTDITEQRQSQLLLQEQETILRNAIELAELGTFSVDITTNLLTASPRIADWFGFDSLTADAESFIAGVDESEREYVRTSLYNTLVPDSDGRYDVIHSVIHAKTGYRRILHALGQIYFDAAGKPLKIEGTAQDITAQRELQLVLEQQVEQRTEELAAVSEELAATNEELAASNEEYAAINEELLATNEEFTTTNQSLERANTDLVRSNQNLEQFAYIASHDLQEPLRKIQQFGDLLKTRFADSVGGEELIYLERMQVAASRMSLLIKDLLAFSRIATSQAVTQPVSLNEVVNQVLESLSVAVEESGAQIEVSALPTVHGDSLQLGQLFQNLLSNALKFRRTTPAGELITPQVTIRASLIPSDKLPTSLDPTREAKNYHLIEVSDNGIGFEEKYLDRIFQVFQRLHGKNEFAGTGVGLAIVQKVVTNHGGAITATGKPDQGATFCVYLPA